jgi:polar amino acid transport system substrate-binding protein
MFSFCLSTTIYADKKKFSIGVEDYKNWLPYTQYKNGAYSGLGKDILEQFAKKNGYTFIYKVYPLKRRDLYFAKGRLDFAFPDNPHWVPKLKKGLKVHYTPVLEFTLISL